MRVFLHNDLCDFTDGNPGLILPASFPEIACVDLKAPLSHRHCARTSLKTVSYDNTRKEKRKKESLLCVLSSYIFIHSLKIYDHCYIMNIAIQGHWEGGRGANPSPLCGPLQKEALSSPSTLRD